MSRRWELTALTGLCVVLFVVCLMTYTKNNSFPYYNHADEGGKVAQLVTRDFNFHHPHLLLLSTDIVRRARGQTDGFQDITETGRLVSAVFAAASVVLLTLVGWKAMGLLGAWCVGLLVAVCPIVGLTAHFLKEDAALLFGFSATLLALLFWLEKPNEKRLIWLGVACGLAVSAKYIGELLLVACAILVLTPAYRDHGKSRFRQLAPMLGAATLVFIVINWPLFAQLESFIGGLRKGVKQMLGISVFFVALLIWLDRPNERRLILVGVACGVAAFEKYIGVLLLFASAVLVLAHAYISQAASKFRPLAVLFATAILVFLGLSLDDFVQTGSFASVDAIIEDFRKGTSEALQGDKSRELLSYITIPRLMTLSWPVLFVASIGILCLVTVFRRSCLIGWVFLVTFVLSTGIILVSDVPVPSRYLLLPAVSLHALAGLAIAMLAQMAISHGGKGIHALRDGRWVKLAAGVAALVLTVSAIPVFQDKAITAFEDADPRAELVAWVNSNLGDGTKLAAYRGVRLPGVGGREPASLLVQFKQEPLTYNSNLPSYPDTLQELLAKGITHVAIGERVWESFLTTHGAGPLKPVIVWRTPERFEAKNRWMRSDLVIVKL